MILWERRKGLFSLNFVNHVVETGSSHGLFKLLCMVMSLRSSQPLCISGSSKNFGYETFT